MKTLTEKELVKLVQKDGNEKAFEKLFYRYNNELSDWIGWLLHKHGLKLDISLGKVDDFAQEIWIRIWESIGSFEFRSDFKTWIFSVARYTVINYCRKNKSRKNEVIDITAIDEHVGIAPIQGEQLILREATDNLLKIFPEIFNTSLTAQQREIIRLKFRGLKNAEIAEQLRTTSNVVYVQFCKA